MSNQVNCEHQLHYKIRDLAFSDLNKVKSKRNDEESPVSEWRDLASGVRRAHYTVVPDIPFHFRQLDYIEKSKDVQFQFSK